MAKGMTAMLHVEGRPGFGGWKGKSYTLLDQVPRRVKSEANTLHDVRSWHHSSFSSWKPLHLPRPTNELVESQPVTACRPGSASQKAGLSLLLIAEISTNLAFFPVPALNIRRQLIAVACAHRWTAMSVSGDSITTTGVCFFMVTFQLAYWCWAHYSITRKERCAATSIGHEGMAKSIDQLSFLKGWEKWMRDVLLAPRLRNVLHCFGLG